VPSRNPIYELPANMRKRLRRSAYLEQQLARGEIKMELDGIKLRGGFVLLYPGKGVSEPGEKTRWLLIKRRYEYADPSWQIDDPALDRSALTGRTLKEIEENPHAKKHIRS
jgi:bifunctional non-homologous end joining protein LigD